MSPQTWTDAARRRSATVRRAARNRKRAARGLPPDPALVGVGQPRRSRNGALILRGITPLRIAVLEVSHDLEQGYLCATPFMSRTEYKLRRAEFEVYRARWAEIAQALRAGTEEQLIP